MQRERHKRRNDERDKPERTQKIKKEYPKIERGNDANAKIKTKRGEEGQGERIINPRNIKKTRREKNTPMEKRQEIPQ